MTSKDKAVEHASEYRRDESVNHGVTLKILETTKDLVGNALMFAFLCSAMLFGAKSLRVPPGLAKLPDGVFNCEYVAYRFKQVQTPGWECDELEGLTFSFVLKSFLALFFIVAVVVVLSLPKPWWAHVRHSSGLFCLGIFIWMTLASGFSVMHRALYIVSGRLYFESLVIPSICLVASFLLARYFYNYVSNLRRYW